MPSHGRQPSPLGAGFQDFYAGRFRLATWLLERHSRLGSQRATSALLLVLIDLLLAACTLSLFILGVKSFDPAWWLLHLLLLGVTMLTLGCTTLSALLALLAAAQLRPVGGDGRRGHGAGVFFQSGAGVQAGSNSGRAKNSSARSSATPPSSKCWMAPSPSCTTSGAAGPGRNGLRSRQERWLWRAVCSQHGRNDFCCYLSLRERLSLRAKRLPERSKGSTPLPCWGIAGKKNLE